VVNERWWLFNRGSNELFNEWNQYWINLAENTNKIVYFFRFEDVLANPREILEELFCLILGLQSIKGTVAE